MFNNFFCWQTPASEINWWVAALLILTFILPQVTHSITDGTFLYGQKRQVDLPLAWHWGIMVGDPILFFVVGIFVAYMSFTTGSIPLMIASAPIGYLLHWSWKAINGHIWPGKPSEKVGMEDKPWQTSWIRNTSAAGWYHMVSFPLFTYFIMEFMFTPLPAKIVKDCTLLLAIFAPFGVFEPGWAEYYHKKQHDPKAKWFLNSFLSLIVLWVAILVTRYYKLP